MVFDEFPDIDFIDETQEEFDVRMVKVKEKWTELDKKLPKEEIYRRESIWNESYRNLKEIEELKKFVNNYYGKPPKEFERRLRRYANARKKI